MNTREVRQAIDRLKDLLKPDKWQTLSNDQKAYLCQLIHADADDTDIALAVASFDHPLTATIKKHRGMFKSKYFLSGVPVETRFDSTDDAIQFAEKRGIEICER
jgi:hypothetical protein